MRARNRALFAKGVVGPAALSAVRKLDPRNLLRNPVIFVTEVGALLTTAGLLMRAKGEPAGFALQVSLWLWFTVLFANFAEAMAEGRGKAQADEVRKTRASLTARLLRTDGSVEPVPAERLRKDDLVVVSAREIIPADGEIIEGAAMVDESAITGASAPVIREAGGDRSAVTGGTRVLFRVHCQYPRIHD